MYGMDGTFLGFGVRSVYWEGHNSFPKLLKDCEMPNIKKEKLFTLIVTPKLEELTKFEKLVP